jgi:hypothetical protein
MYQDEGNSISREEYAKGNILFGFDLTSNHLSFRQLSQKHVVLDVIDVATGNRIYFDFYTSDGVFTAGLYQS